MLSGLECVCNTVRGCLNVAVSKISCHFSLGHVTQSVPWSLVVPWTSVLYPHHLDEFFLVSVTHYDSVSCSHQDQSLSTFMSMTIFAFVSVSHYNGCQCLEHVVCNVELTNESYNDFESKRREQLDLQCQSSSSRSPSSKP